MFTQLAATILQGIKAVDDAARDVAQRRGTPIRGDDTASDDVGRLAAKRDVQDDERPHDPHHPSSKKGNMQ